MTGPSERWDIFCRVVDNFGDAGVSWRLSRQLAREHAKRVRLWLDDVAVLARLRPEIDPALESQTLEGVEVCRMRDAFTPGDVADVVVETFGCDPPPGYVDAMVARTPKPRWINLEYLSAEDWVEGSHSLPSPHPRLPLTKHFFFPGFTHYTGGVLRERDLVERRDAFQEEPGMQARFWTSIAGAVPPGGALKVSLFTYEGAPVSSLVAACARLRKPVWLVAPEGIASAALEEAMERHHGEDCADIEAFVVPFLAQDRYDELLWACDVNFVRGEDSFVRAQWAARPFVWHIYPQKENAHRVKLRAFLAKYAGSLEPHAASALAALWEGWNGMAEPGEMDGRIDAAWSAFAARREALSAHARAWSARLQLQRDLARQLVDFVEKVLK